MILRGKKKQISADKFSPQGLNVAQDLWDVRHTPKIDGGDDSEEYSKSRDSTAASGSRP